MAPRRTPNSNGPLSVVREWAAWKSRKSPFHRCRACRKSRTAAGRGRAEILSYHADVSSAALVHASRSVDPGPAVIICRQSERWNRRGRGRACALQEPERTSIVSRHCAAERTRAAGDSRAAPNRKARQMSIHPRALLPRTGTMCAAVFVFAPLAAIAQLDLGETKVTICHVPPGNPANAHTIVVGAPAVPAHLRHGDSVGACGSGGGGGGECGGIGTACAGSNACCAGLTCVDDLMTPCAGGAC